MIIREERGAFQPCGKNNILGWKTETMFCAVCWRFLEKPDQDLSFFKRIQNDQNPALDAHDKIRNNFQCMLAKQTAENPLQACLTWARWVTNEPRQQTEKTQRWSLC